MSAIQILSSQPWVERLGWTLVHFLWQGLAIAVIYEATRRGMARRSNNCSRRGYGHLWPEEVNAQLFLRRPKSYQV